MRPSAHPRPPSYAKWTPTRVCSTILLQILGTSPFLSEILIRNPEYLYWLRRKLDAALPDRVDYDAELGRLVDTAQSGEHQANVLKRFQRREMLRVAARDLFGMLNRESLTTTTTQLSNLADTLVDHTLRIAASEAARKQGPLPGRFAVIGMGKLGGGDLNYSSDIDLIYVYDAPEQEVGRGPRTLPEARAASHGAAVRPHDRGLSLPRRHAPAADGSARQPRLLPAAVGAVLRESRRDVRAVRPAQGAADRGRSGVGAAVRRQDHAVRVPQVHRPRRHRRARAIQGARRS